MKIKRIHIVESVSPDFGTDRIFLITDLPDESGYKFTSKTNVELEFEVKAWNGVKYCKKYFPRIKREVTNISKGIYKNQKVCNPDEYC